MSEPPAWRVLVTGSSGHLGEAVMRVLRSAEAGEDGGIPRPIDLAGIPTDFTVVAAVGVDTVPGAFTDVVADIADRSAITRVFADHQINGVIHAATLHKPHVATHTQQQFVDTNISGTLTLIEAAQAAGVAGFVFTSTTSVYSKAVARESAATGVPAWVDETTRPAPKNIYGVTKLAAEGLCGLHLSLHDFPVVVLRTSRFFHEPDDDEKTREAFSDGNSKANEFLYRRVDVEDIVQAHLLAMLKAAVVAPAHKASLESMPGTAPTFIVSAPPPFNNDDLANFATRSVEAMVMEAVSDKADASLTKEIYATRGWRFPDHLDRIYDSSATVRALGWQPRFSFVGLMKELQGGEMRPAAQGGDMVIGSALAAAVGRKGYHGVAFTGSMDAAGQPFPVEAQELRKAQA